MPLRLLKGPVGSGKTQFLLDLTGKEPATRSSLYVLPSDYTAGEIRHLYLGIHQKPLLGDLFLSWGHFLRRLARINNPTISRTHLTLFLYQLLKTHPLRYFRPENISMGIAREFANTIISLKQNLIEPAHLRGELETKGSLKENDLLTIYERYEEERKKRGIIDEGDLALQAISNINAGVLHGLEGTGRILIDEFQSFPPGIRTTLKNLTHALKHIDIWVTHPITTDSKTPYAQLWDKSASLIESFADSVETLNLRHQPQSHVEAFSCRSPTMEARFIARKISELASNRASKEDTTEKISVSIRSNDTFVYNLLTECERYGLLENAYSLDIPMSAPIIHRLLSPEVLAEMDHTGTIESYCAHLRDQLQRFDALTHYKAGIPNRCSSFSVSRNLAAMGSLDQLLRALTTKAKIFGTENISRRSFIELIRDALGSSTSWNALQAALPFSIRPFEIPPVCKMETTFIPRMSEGHIPQTTSERLFFGEMENWDQHTESALDEIFEGPEQKLARETALYNSILDKTKNTAMVSHSVVDHSGNEVIASSFLDNLVQIQSVDVPPEISIQKKSRSLERHLNNAVTIERERLCGHLEHLEYHGIMTDCQLKDMLKERFTSSAMSPTSLERYAECPFQFFVEKVLNLKPEEEITPDILPKDRGTIIHTLLERFYRDHLDAFKNAIRDPESEPKLAYIVDKLIDQVFLEHASLIRYASPSLDTYQRRAVTTLAMQVIRLELVRAREVPQPLLPEKCEWCFGEGNLPPLEIPVEDDAPAKIKGRVDRIDTSEDKRYFAVTDYKTGSSVRSVKNDIAKGLHLQLPLYVEAVSKLLMSKAEPLGGILIGVQQSEKKHGFLKKSYNEIHYSLSNRLSTLLSDEAWNDLFSTALNFTGKYAVNIRQGLFPAKPHQCNDYCDYKDVCRFNEEAD